MKKRLHLHDLTVASFVTGHQDIKGGRDSGGDDCNTAQRHCVSGAQSCVSVELC